MFGFDRPQCCLKLGPRHAVWVERRCDWRGRAEVRSRVVDLPEGLLQPSPVEPNISDPAALAPILRRAIGSEMKSGVPVVLILPDLCVRATLLEVEALPARPSEREALIRWRLERESAFSLAGSKVAVQFFPPKTVLAVVIRETVLRQYEAACEAVGLSSVEVDIASLRLGSVQADSVGAAGPIAVLSLLDEGFTFFIHRGGRPVFLRTKIRSGSGSEGLFQDLARSLAFYAESHPQAPPQRLLLISEEPDSAMVQRITDELRLDVVQAGGATLRMSERFSSGQAPPAVAGLLKAAPKRINLSSIRRSYVGAARAALVLLSLIFLGLIAWDLQQAQGIAAQTAEAEQALARVRDQDGRLRLQAQAEGVDLSDAALQRLPREVAFANQIIAKRVFSWTRFLSDLEDAVPPRVGVHSIRFDVKDSMIGLVGSALSLKDLTAFIIVLEDHRAFQDAVLGQHKVQDNGLVEFGLTVRYRNDLKEAEE